jgi:ribose transport system substrate-binding protein
LQWSIRGKPEELMNKMIAAGLAVLAALTPAGCGEAPQGGKPRIALVMKSLANEFFLTMENGAREHQKKNAGAYELLANGIKDETDVLKQVEIIDQMVAQRVDAIVIAPADSRALINVCQRAMDAGITVVNIDNKLDAEVLAAKNLRIPVVGPDNREGARLAGEYLARRLKTGDEVAIIEGLPGAFNGIQRRLGFEDAMKSAGLKIAESQSAEWHTEKANKIVAAMLPAHPNLKGILCANDNMALGAVAALKAAGKSDEVLVVGFDNLSDVQKLVKGGRMLATVDQHGDQLAAFGIEYAIEILKTRKVPEDKKTPVDLITREALE